MYCIRNTVGSNLIHVLNCILAFLLSCLLTTGCGMLTQPKDNRLATYQADCQALVIQQLDNQEVLENRLNKEIETFADLVTSVHRIRNNILPILEQLSPANDEVTPLPPDLLGNLQKSYQENIPFFDYLEQTGLESSCWLSFSDYPELEEAVILKGASLYVATGAAIYDNYRQVYSYLNEHDRIRRFINQGDSGYGAQKNQLEMISEKVILNTHPEDVPAGA